MPKSPEQASGRLCGKRVEQGVIAYGCTLPQGHEFRNGEPCYAVEVDRSVRVWRRWADEQEAKAKEAERETKATPFDQEKFPSVEEAVALSAQRIAAEIEDGLVAVASPQDTVAPVPEPVREIRVIAAKAEAILAKDPSLTTTLALWLAAEQITRKDRAE